MSAASACSAPPALAARHHTHASGCRRTRRGGAKAPGRHSARAGALNVVAGAPAKTVEEAKILLEREGYTFLARPQRYSHSHCDSLWKRLKLNRLRAYPNSRPSQRASAFIFTVLQY
jgi:hypothetical protein